MLSDGDAIGGGQMLEEVQIAKIATYPEELQRLHGLQKINFIFGTNGSGKTSLSRVLADPEAHPTCALSWRTGRPLVTLVYNKDFVDRTFMSQMPGIFTLGEVEAATLNLIEQSRAKVEELEGQIATLNLTLDAPDHSSGKRADLIALRNAFEGECWKIKIEHDPHFQRAFDGLRNSKTKFCDHVLEESANNQPPLDGLDNLKARALTVFADEVTHLDWLPELSTHDLHALESSPVLSKKIVGKEDIDIGGLIRRLGNSDWVRDGLQYVDGPDMPCPFCQQTLDEKLLAKLNAFFDETYLADVAAIAQMEETYGKFSKATLEVVDAVLASGSAHINFEVLRPLTESLRSAIALNKLHIGRKRKEPSAPITLEPLNAALDAIAAIIGRANLEITRHNTLVDNLAVERMALISNVWKRLTEDKKGVIGAYTTAKSDLDKAITGITSHIETKTGLLTAAKATLAELEKGVTSVQPTVTEINATLASFGFTSFKLATAGTNGGYYSIQRGDGSDARETLSEGERSFITFLYFYHLIRGSTSVSGVTTNRVVVFDDPVSSLDSDVLFIVSSLIKRVLAEACGGNGRVKQVFVLTHNIYFHKEVSFDPKRQTDRRFHETFWVVRKVENKSKVQGYPNNPIKTSYELLWDEVRNPARSSLTIQNVLRRILEHYFTILGNMDKDAVIAKFDGRDQQICATLFSWINDGSHNFADDLYVVADDTGVQRYLDVFKRIFEQTDHGAHYRMMIGPEAADTEQGIAVAVAAAAEPSAMPVSTSAA